MTRPILSRHQDSLNMMPPSRSRPLVVVAALLGLWFFAASSASGQSPPADGPATATTPNPPPPDAANPAAPATDTAGTTSSAAPTAADPNKLPWIVKHLDSGGKTVWVQLALSVVGLGVVFERFWSLRRSRLAPRDLPDTARKLWAAGRYDDLLKRCDADGSVLAQTIASIVRHRRADLAQVSMIAGDLASREFRRHLQRCYPIAIVATIEPLLGLFGTVRGMIDAFDVVALAGSMGNPALLADSIAVALVTTEVGLAIAIPFLIVYQVLKSRVAMLGTVVEEQASDLLTDWYVGQDGSARPPAAAIPGRTAPDPTPAAPEPVKLAAVNPAAR